jgi:hypothetical protein
LGKFIVGMHVACCGTPLASSKNASVAVQLAFRWRWHLTPERISLAACRTCGKIFKSVSLYFPGPLTEIHFPFPLMARIGFGKSVVWFFARPDRFAPV